MVGSGVSPEAGWIAWGGTQLCHLSEAQLFSSVTWRKTPTGVDMKSKCVDPLGVLGLVTNAQ